ADRDVYCAPAAIHSGRRRPGNHLDRRARPAQQPAGHRAALRRDRAPKAARVGAAPGLGQRQRFRARPRGGRADVQPRGQVVRSGRVGDRPLPYHARDSVQYIISTAPLGNLMRGIHFWTSNIVMITVLLHMARAFATGSYKRPREVTWLTGVVLLAVTLGLVFTGSVLKWDQEAYEALSHNLEVGDLLGGLGVWFSAEVTQSVEVLGALYLAHGAILPVGLTLFVALPFLLVKRHGISPWPREADAAVEGGPAPERGGSTFAHHLGRMGLIGLVLLVLSLVLTLIWVPALGPVPNPKVEMTKPPWMFLPLYPFEEWFTVKALLWVPVIIFLGLIAVPFVDRGRYMSPRRRVVVVVIGLAIGLTLLALGIKAQVSPVEPHMLEGVM